MFGGVAAVTTLAFVYDDDIYNFVNGTFSENQSNTISKYTDVFGEEYFILPSVALTYAIGMIDKDSRLRNMSLAVLQSFVYAEVASAGLKVLTCRERPTANSQQPTANSQWPYMAWSIRHFRKHIVSFRTRDAFLCLGDDGRRVLS